MKTSTKKSTKATTRAKPAATTANATPTPKAWPRDPRNPYRPGSAYGVCYDILAAHGEAGIRPKHAACEPCRGWTRDACPRTIDL